MLVAFSPIFVGNKKIIFVYNFVAPLKFLVTEIFESVSKSNSEFMWSDFSYKNLYNLRSEPTRSSHLQSYSLWNEFCAF